jgi:hypothetical protein
MISDINHGSSFHVNMRYQFAAIVYKIRQNRLLHQYPDNFFMQTGHFWTNTWRKVSVKSN